MRPRNTSAATALAIAGLAVAASPAMATYDDAVITPMVDCVQETQYGYVAHFTYAADDLHGGSDVHLGRPGHVQREEQAVDRRRHAEREPAGVDRDLQGRQR